MWAERERQQHPSTPLPHAGQAGRTVAAPAPAVAARPRPLSPADVLRLQRVAGNTATAGLVAHPVTVQRDEEKERLAKLLQAAARGRRVREQVRVREEAPGIIGVRIRNTDPHVLGNIAGSPLDAIRQPLAGSNAEYNHLRVLGGATQGAVRGPGPGQPGEKAGVLAQGLPPGTAVINGGYFAHTTTIRSEEGWVPQPIDPHLDPYEQAQEKHHQLAQVGTRGRPVGPTSHRGDHLPVPSEYAAHYGQVEVGGQVGLSSGPMLHDQGVPHALPTDERFRYKVPYDGGEEFNPRNEQAGALTHAGDRNARAAVSTQGADLIMHTVTNPSMAPNTGATMAQWQQMTAAGAGNRADPLSTLNLDGGGSVYLGITQPGGMQVVAKGQRPTELEERPVANIIASHPRR